MAHCILYARKLSALFIHWKALRNQVISSNFLENYCINNTFLKIYFSCDYILFCKKWFLFHWTKIKWIILSLAFFVNNLSSCIYMCVHFWNIFSHSILQKTFIMLLINRMRYTYIHLCVYIYKLSNVVSDCILLANWVRKWIITYQKKESEDVYFFSIPNKGFAISYSPV